MGDDAGMTRLFVSDVFTPTSYPKYTYVKRDELHHERLLLEWMRSSSQTASVSGPSKAGKTVLVQRVVGVGNLVTVSGASVRTPDQLWDRVLDWWGEPHATTVSHIDTTSEQKGSDKGVNIGVSGTGATHKSSTTTGELASDTSLATANRRGLPQVVQELAGTQYTLLLDDFHYIPQAIQGDVAQQIKDAASRGVRICVASVPHRADTVVRALPELRGRVLSVDVDYWGRRDLLEIAKLGCAHLGITIDQESLTVFAMEAAGSPQLMQSICLWMCNQLGIRETQEPAKTFTIDEATRDEILFLTCCNVEFRSLARALISGPRVAKPGDRRTYEYKDGKKGDIYMTIVRAIAMDPPRLAIDYTALGLRLDELVKGDRPDGASIIRACVSLGQIAEAYAGPTGPSLEWDDRDQVLVVPDPYLLFYLRWSKFLDRELDAEP
jgi:hypothetical protein